MKKLYKVLETDLKSPYQSFQFEIGKKYHCDNFDTDRNETCSYGFYAVGIDGLAYAFRTSRKIFEVKVSGQEVEIDCFKRRYEYIELIKEVGINDVIKKAKAIENKLGYKLSEVLNPVNPLLIKPPKITAKEKQLLKQWDSVRASVEASVEASVWDSVRDSVGDSVRASVGDSVWDSVWASVEASVGDSVRAYISSLFPLIKKWGYIEHEEGKNPFQSCIDLWKAGLVPSFDGKIWRLHGGENAKVLFEISKEELVK